MYILSNRQCLWLIRTYYVSKYIYISHAEQQKYCQKMPHVLFMRTLCIYKALYHISFFWLTWNSINCSPLFCPKKDLVRFNFHLLQKRLKKRFWTKKLTKSEFHEYQMIEIWYNDFSTYLRSVGTVRGGRRALCVEIGFYADIYGKIFFRLYVSFWKI